MTAETYSKLWATEAYRRWAPGEDLAYRFCEIAKPQGTVVDFGCGTGRGALLIHALANVPVIGLDWSANALDASVAESGAVEFRQHDLRQPLPETHSYGYCTDVLEHIAPEDVDQVLTTILHGARRVFLSISTKPDHFGPAILGEPLHLTVENHAWWKQKLLDHGANVMWEQETENAAMFYVSAYLQAQTLMEATVINSSDETLKTNIAKNLALELPEVRPHQPSGQRIILLAGGPSLSAFAEQIKEDALKGTPVVTTNGAYNWCLERGIRPAAQIMVDSRPWNRRFVEPIVDACKYLMGSQVDHELVASLPRSQTLLWHSDTPTTEAVLQDGKEHYPVIGGTTVMLRALPLLAMLGFRQIEVYGWDSCLSGDEHHAYSQPENDSKRVLNVIVDGREFSVHPWMLVQAHEWQKVMRELARVEDYQLCVHGDGLIAHIIATAAKRGNHGS